MTRGAGTLSVLGDDAAVGVCASAVDAVGSWCQPGIGGYDPPADEVNPRRPMPRDASATRVPPPPFEDAPIVSQAMPEQTAFVDTYNRVGRPAHRGDCRMPRIAQCDDASTNEASECQLSD